jgi:hypothetical protein
MSDNTEKGFTLHNDDPLKAQEVQHQSMYKIASMYRMKGRLIDTGADAYRKSECCMVWKSNATGWCNTTVT